MSIQDREKPEGQTPIDMFRIIGLKTRYPETKASSQQSRGAALITEETREVLLTDLNLPPDPSLTLEVNRVDPDRQHPMRMAMGIFEDEFGYISSVNKSLAQNCLKWANEVFGNQPTVINAVASGVGLVLRAYRRQCQWPFLDRFITLDGGMVDGVLREDSMTLQERQSLFHRAINKPEVPLDQPHLRYCIDRLGDFCNDSFALADGAGGMYRVINRFWDQLLPPAQAIRS